MGFRFWVGEAKLVVCRLVVFFGMRRGEVGLG